MSITQQHAVEVLAVEVQDDYTISVTARDIFTGAEVVVTLSHGDAIAHADEVLGKVREAKDAIHADRRMIAEAGVDKMSAALAAVGSFMSGEVDDFARSAESTVQSTALGGANILSTTCGPCREERHDDCLAGVHEEGVYAFLCQCTADGHRGRS
ncbi:hypothetical protein [Microbacterium sp.]|uniref:hypothetical protein n=1 Tax=Microbacterium sp. TaxID=51671 RepID=UPI0039E5158D